MTPVLPGGMLGILGGGQLGRMLALEARRMGYHICILDPTPGCPASQIADLHLCAPLEDPQALGRLTGMADVITYETEHIPSAALQACSAATTLRPSADLLHTVQNRLTQRRFLTTHGIPQTRYAAVDDRHSLHSAVRDVGLPALLKSRFGGYDGKGQVRLTTEPDLEVAWAALDRAPAVLEAYVPFYTEISVILARSLEGEVRFYPVAENVHRQNVLHTTCVPALVPREVCQRAKALARTIAEALDYCGVMAVEMFVLRDTTLLVNEIAPRVHNSGHYTFGACLTSQFEQHLRAICGLPLGDTTLLQSVVMLNLLGDLWRNGMPPWQTVLAHPNAQLHLYGKAEARPGRKMGHVLCLGRDTSVLLQQSKDILAALGASQHLQPHNGEPVPQAETTPRRTAPCVKGLETG